MEVEIGDLSISLHEDFYAIIAQKAQNSKASHNRAIPYWNVPYDMQNFATFCSLVTIHKKEWSYVLLLY